MAVVAVVAGDAIVCRSSLTFHRPLWLRNDVTVKEQVLARDYASAFNAATGATSKKSALPRSLSKVDAGSARTSGAM